MLILNAVNIVDNYLTSNKFKGHIYFEFVYSGIYNGDTNFIILSHSYFYKKINGNKRIKNFQSGNNLNNDNLIKLVRFAVSNQKFIINNQKKINISSEIFKRHNNNRQTINVYYYKQETLSIDFEIIDNIFKK